MPTRRNSLLTNKLAAITERYQIIRAIGSDSISTMFLCKELISESIRTIREINKHTIGKNTEFLTEYTILRQLDHPNIIKIFEVCETFKNLYIVLENISGGSLLSRFKRLGFEAEISRFAYELFGALNYIHKQNIIHCNICSDTVVLSSLNDDAVVKVIGFLSARQAGSTKEIDLNKLCIEFCSPEMLNGSPCDKSDVWSAGVLIYSLLTTKRPFPRGNIKETIEAIIAGNVEYHNSGFNSISKTGKDLIRSMFIVNPAERPSFEVLISHPWFSESKQALPITYNIAKKISTFQIKSHLTRCLLDYIASKRLSKDFTIMKYFKSLDLNNDGKVSKEEILTTFQQVGFNVEAEIDFIMENLDYDSSGFIDYTELVLALTNWNEELKYKNLVKAFVNKEGMIYLPDLLKELPDIDKDEMMNFKKECNEKDELIHIKDLKRFLKN